MKICLVGAELFRADRRKERHTVRGREGKIDMTKLIAVFRNFANASKNQRKDTEETKFILKTTSIKNYMIRKNHHPVVSEVFPFWCQHQLG
jgi:hypothetical protein